MSVKSLMKMGVMAPSTSRSTPITAELVVTEFGHRIKRVTEPMSENRPGPRCRRRKHV